MRRISGFTLIEVMVSVAVLGLVTSYLTLMLVQQSRGYEVVDDVTEVQQNLRAIGDLIEHDVLVTGMMMPSAGAICGIDNAQNGTDILFVTDTDGIVTAGEVEPDLGIPITVGYDGTDTDVLTILRGDVEKTATADLFSYDNDNPPDNVADSDFPFMPAAGQVGGVIVADPTNPALGSQCGIITNVSAPLGGPYRITVDWEVTIGGTAMVPVERPLLGASSLVVIPAHVYVVSWDGAAGTPTQLLRDGLLLADDVEDLQVSYFHDVNDDGVVDANEWSGGAGGPAYTADGRDNSLLRAVRFSVVIRTASQDAVALQDPTKASGVFQVRENAPARAFPPDGYRRRVFTRTVLPRNVLSRGAV